MHCLSNHSANELEEVEMIRIHIGLLICIVGSSIIAEVKECIVWFEHTFWQFNEEVSSQTTSINTFFIAISNPQLSS